MTEGRQNGGGGGWGKGAGCYMDSTGLEREAIESLLGHVSPLQCYNVSLYIDKTWDDGGGGGGGGD